jgi:hypothetical protein
MRKLSCIEAVVQACEWCAARDYENELLELNRSEFIDLLNQQNNVWPQEISYLHNDYGSTYINVFGVAIKQIELPFRSAIRMKYLQLINAAVWIEWLAKDMEQYT